MAVCEIGSHTGEPDFLLTCLAIIFGFIQATPASAILQFVSMAELIILTWAHNVWEFLWDLKKPYVHKCYGFQTQKILKNCEPIVKMHGKLQQKKQAT